MADFKDRILELRLEKNFNQEELAKALDVSKSTVGMWEIGKRLPGPDKYEEIADYFNVDMDYLYGRTDIRQKIHYDKSGNEYVLRSQISHGVEIPVLGRVAAGIPITAAEYVIDTEEISQAMAADGEYFGLQIKGDSMEPKISNGDVVIVRKQSDADEGDLVIALVNGNDAVCKRLKKYVDGIALISTNPAYEPMYFSNKEISEKPVAIIGKVKELRAKF